MRIKITLALLLANIAFYQLVAQNIITINEKDRDGKHLKKDSVFKNNRIVDINSVLDIQIDRSKMIEAISTHHPEKLPDQLSDKITAIVNALEKRNIILSEINATLNTYDYNKFINDESAHKAFADKLQRMVSEVYFIEGIDPRIGEEAVKFEKPEEIYSSVYDAAITVLSELEKEFAQFADESGIYIQFGGWLVTKDKNVPIHLQGFDDIAPQDPYEVERWQFIPTQQQIDEINRLQQLARDNRDKGLNILKQIAQMQLDALKDFGNSKINSLTIKLENELARLAESFNGSNDQQVNQTIDSLKNIESAVKSFILNFNQRLDYYKNISFVNGSELVTFLQHAGEDINFILTADSTFRFSQKIAAFTRFVNSAPDAIKIKADSSRRLIDSINAEYIVRITSFKRFAESKVDELLLGKKLDIAAMEFGEDVYKLSIADVPVSTDLDLYFTGVRTDGDRLALKMACTIKESKKTMILETREIYLFRVLPHGITTVGVIFADPLAINQVETQFQMAPSFNFIFKGLFDQKARRRSIVYNRMLDWGLGIHLSAPDFDKDDVPEIAAGAVVSTLHDYIQCGFAFNLFTGDPFWFFGLKFPVPSFNLSTSTSTPAE